MLTLSNFLGPTRPTGKNTKTFTEELEDPYMTGKYFVHNIISSMKVVLLYFFKFFFFSNILSYLKIASVTAGLACVT